MTDEITRRQFWRLPPSKLLGSLLTGRGLREGAEAEPIRPPGAAAPDSAFLDRCERCGACAEACPHDVIALLGPEGGIAEGTPILDPAGGPCRWCPEWDCIAACPSGALALAEGESPAPIALARLDPGACLVGQGILCDVCLYRCPSTIRAVRLVGRQPRIDAAACVGCGLCSYYCAAEPSAIAVLPLGGDGREPDPCPEPPSPA